MTEISRRQFAVYLVAVVLVVLLGGRALRADAGPGAPADVPAGGFTARAGAQTAAGSRASGGSGPTGSTGSGALEVTTATERLLVHVAGAVQRPGVYELPAGARIKDALAEAGGGRGRADLNALNLAAKVTDGQQVLVARRSKPGSASAAGPGTVGGPAGSAPTAATGTSAASATVNVNQADAMQLELLNGVGPAIAVKIVDWRTQNGPFKTVDDLAQVPGIGPKKLEAMRGQVTI